MNYRVKELCKENGITLTELAEKIEMKSANLSASLSEKGNPTILTLQKIAEALGVHITELFERSQTSSLSCPKCGAELELKIKK